MFTFSKMYINFEMDLYMNSYNQFNFENYGECISTFNKAILPTLDGIFHLPKFYSK
jgi:hypothetical protein